MKLGQRNTELEKSGNNKKLQEEYVKFRQDEEFLRGSEEKFRILVEMATDAIFLETTEGRILECNTAGAKMFGYTKEEMIGLTIADLVPEEFAKILPKVITEKETTYGIFVPRVNKKKDGTLFPTEITTKLVNMRGKHRLIIYVRDITERKKNEKLQEVLYSISKAANSNISLDQLYPLIHQESNKIIDATNFHISLSNKNKSFFSYYSDEKDERSQIHKSGTTDNLAAYISRYGKSILVNHKQIMEMASQKKIKLSQLGTLTNDVLLLGVPLKIEGDIIGSMAVLSYTNTNLYNKKDIKLMEFVSEQVATAIQRKQLEEKLEKLAHFDSLVGICNRRYCLELLNRHIKLAKRNKTPILLAYIDIDNFKIINDTYGHKEGDEILKEIVKLFKITLREIDIICRVGGDEFLLIFPDSSFNDAPLIRERLNKNLEKLKQTLDKPYNIGLSIGISYYNPSNPLSIDELISIADENMYKEKNKKRKQSEDSKKN
jgi:diguanylate cyclase (GGDEF)-like protein/PAS domain S-box-containing protein